MITIVQTRPLIKFPTHTPTGCSITPVFQLEIVKIRKRVHIGMAVIMGITIFVFNLLNNTSVIDAVYILASYTYGPILGLFAFGIFMKQQVRDKYIPLVAIVSPLLCFILQKNSEAWFNGYQFSYELLIFNALFTFIGLCILIKKDKKNI